MTCKDCAKTQLRNAALCQSIAGLAAHLRQIEAQARAQLTGHQPRGTWAHWQATADLAGNVAGLLEKLAKAGCKPWQKTLAEN